MLNKINKGFNNKFKNCRMIWMILRRNMKKSINN